MSRAGIGLCVPSVASPGLQFVVDPGEAVELGEDVNNDAQFFMTRHSGWFSPLAAVSLQDPNVTTDEMSRTVGSCGLVGAMVSAYT